MRFGVIGLGSMGKRRVRDLLALGHHVVGFDIRDDRISQAKALFKIETVHNLETVLDMKPDGLVISTPPDQHFTAYERCFEAQVPFFSEANILTPSVRWFAERESQSGVKGYPSATWRFYPLFQILRQEVQNREPGDLYSVHDQYGGYLPAWHPWERYQDFYAGRSRRTCAAREMVPFELEWLSWLFGPVKAVCAVRDRRARWTTDIDDTYLLLLEFESGLKGSLHVELHQTVPFRLARIAGRNVSLTVDLLSHELKRYSPETDCWRIAKPSRLEGPGAFDFEQVYRAEIEAFVLALQGHAPYSKTWTEDRHLSTVLYAAEESWRRRAWVEVVEAERRYTGVEWTQE